MKFYNLAILLLLLTLSTFGQELDTIWVSNNNQKLSVNTINKDLGLINQGDKTTFKFVLKNLDEKPLLVWHVSSSCGCTVPSWTKKPVKHEEEAVVKVKYDAAEIGVFTKSVFVYSNFDDKPIKLTIKGTVVNPKSHADVSTRKPAFNGSLPQNQ